jgi:outer membrane protein TolC
MAVNLQASVLARKFNSQPGWPRYQTWQVNATYPLFDGGLAGSRTQREALKLVTKQAELEAEQAQTQIEIDRLQALLASMQTIVASMEEQCRLQNRIAEDMLSRFDLGRGSLTEVTEAYLSATECSLTVVRNRADHFTKYHDLSRLNGTLANLIMGAKQ